MASHPLSNRILVYSLPPLSPSDALSFVSTLTALPTSSAPPPASSSLPSTNAPPPPPASAALVPWLIKNRYYSARVAFHLLPFPAEGAEPPSEQDGEDEGEAPAVVVLAPALPTPPPALALLLARLAAREPEFDVALLVSLPLPSSSASAGTGARAAKEQGELDEAAWDDLALEHGFEWVQCQCGSSGSGGERASSSSAAAAGETDPEDIEEGQGGLARVVDALQAHMWDGMERAELSTSGASAPTRRPRDLDDDDDDSELLSSLGAPPLPSPRPFVPFQLNFPETFLPNVPRRAEAVAGAGAGEGAEDKERQEEGDERDEFEDDFSPFVDAASSSSASFPDPSFSLPDELNLSALSALSALSPSSRAADPADPDLTPSDLDALFASLSTARARAGAMQTLEERRAFAEKFVGELMGGLDGEGSEEGEE
ncbi:hypothetical protein JCM10207_003345 [Rhodosporidiobolus poonsookiae]